MKILKTGYVNGEALFVLEGLPGRTFCIPLKDVTTQEEVTEQLKTRVKSLQQAQEDKYKSLNIKELEGEDI